MKQFVLPHILKITLVVLASAIGVLIVFTLISDSSPDPVQVSKVSEATITIDGESRQENLPIILQDLPHGTEVKVSFTVSQEPGDSLFFGSVYAPLIIKSGENTIFEYGYQDSYPFFMTDPPTTYDDILLPDTQGKEAQIEMIYHSPQDRDSLSIHAPYVGHQRDILRMLTKESGVQMALAIIILILGLALVIMSAFLIPFPYQRKALFYPGLLCLFAGAWQLGENRLAVYLMESPSILYILDFCGLFLLVIPLYKMAMLFLDRPDNRFLQSGLLILKVAAGIAVILQLTGLVGLHKSLYAFHIILPLGILLLVAICIYLFIRYRNRNAGLFTLPFSILLVAAILELANYYLGFFPQNSAVFQIGLVFFLLAMGVFSGMSVRRNLSLQIKAIELEHEVQLQEQAIEAQKNRNELLLSHYEDVRKQRHDLRHHMRVLQELLENEKNAEAMEYISTLTASLPTYTPEVFCDNLVVNSILCFYLQQMKADGTNVKLRVQVPADNPNITDSNLCIVFGNLMENAMEACHQIQNIGFVTLSSRVKGDMLFITMDNSAPSQAIRTFDGLYLSSKSHDRGLGLRSIRSIAERYEGSAEFHEKNGVFQSEVCLKL